MSEKSQQSEFSARAISYLASEEDEKLHKPFFFFVSAISYFASQEDYEKRLEPKGVVELGGGGGGDDTVKPSCDEYQDGSFYHFTVTKSTGHFFEKIQFLL